MSERYDIEFVEAQRDKAEAELLALRARNAKLEAALKQAQFYVPLQDGELQASIDDVLAPQ